MATHLGYCSLLNSILQICLIDDIHLVFDHWDCYIRKAEHLDMEGLRVRMELNHWGNCLRGPIK